MERKSGDELQLGALVSHCEHMGTILRLLLTLAF